MAIDPSTFTDFDLNNQILQKCSFIANSKPDVVVETSILIIGLLSYVHSKEAYKMIFMAIEQVLVYYIEDIIKGDSKLVLCRYSLFLGYMIDVLFKQNPQAFKETVLFLYQSVNLQGENKAIALQSIDTLKTVTCDQDLIPRF